MLWLVYKGIYKAKVMTTGLCLSSGQPANMIIFSERAPTGSVAGQVTCSVPGRFYYPEHAFKDVHASVPASSDQTLPHCCRDPSAFFSSYYKSRRGVLLDTVRPGSIGAGRESDLGRLPAAGVVE